MGSGVKAIHQATRHYEEIGFRRIEVPEWGGDDGPA